MSNAATQNEDRGPSEVCQAVINDFIFVAIISTAMRGRQPGDPVQHLGVVADDHAERTFSMPSTICVAAAAAVVSLEAISPECSN